MEIVYFHISNSRNIHTTAALFVRVLSGLQALVYAPRAVLNFF